MKKLIYLVVALFTFSLVNAQASFGVKAGVNLASLNSSDSDFNSMIDGRTAFHVGGVANIPVSEFLSIQPEILYSSVGGKFTETFMEEDIVFNFIENYLSIPVMAKYYVAEGFSLQAGPQVGILLSAKAKGEYDGETDEEDYTDDMESLDVGLGLGVGYEMENGLFFNARYMAGMINTWKDTGDEWVKNNVTQVSVGFMFN